MKRSLNNLKVYLSARFLVTCAYQMQTVAVGWEVYGIRKEPLDLGWAGLAQFLPLFLFSVIGGQTADRFPRKRIVQSAHFCFALLSLGLAYYRFTHDVAMLWVFYAVLILQGILRAFSNPAVQSLLPELVEQTRFSRAVALNATVWQISTILGPVIGGAILAVFGKGAWVYFFCGLSILCSVTLLNFVKVFRVIPPADPNRKDGLFDGVKYVFGKRLLLGAISLDLFAVLLGGAVALLPIFAADILHVGPTGLGLLRAAPGAGAIAMSLWLAAKPLKRNVGTLLFANVAIFGLATIGFGLSRSFALSLFLLFISGMADIVSVVIRMTLVQLETPDAMRGRVSAVNSVFISASNELGEFESGLTAAWFGVIPAVVMGGVGTLFVALFWAWKFPELRRKQTLD